MLASVVAADDGRRLVAGVGHGQGVCQAVSYLGTADDSGWGRESGGVCQHHRVKVNPQFADIGVGPTECVGAGIRI